MRRLVVVALALTLAVAVPALAGQNTVRWTENAGNEEGLRLERCQGPGCSNFTVLVTLPENAAAYTDQAVADGQTYCYRVSAFNATGASAPSNVACRMIPTPVLGPAAPTSLTVSP